jgi:hypothetical protein
MRQAGLVSDPMTLLGGVAVGEPHSRAVAVHHLANHRGGSRRGGVMHDSLGRAEDPVVSVRALDPDAGLVRSHNCSAAQGSYCPRMPIGKAPLRPLHQVHQAALAEREAEQV